MYIYIWAIHHWLGPKKGAVLLEITGARERTTAGDFAISWATGTTRRWTKIVGCLGPWFEKHCFKLCQWAKNGNKIWEYVLSNYRNPKKMGFRILVMLPIVKNRDKCPKGDTRTAMGKKWEHQLLIGPIGKLFGNGISNQFIVGTSSG